MNSSNLTTTPYQLGTPQRNWTFALTRNFRESVRIRVGQGAVPGRSQVGVQGSVIGECTGIHLVALAAAGVHRCLAELPELP